MVCGTHTVGTRNEDMPGVPWQVGWGNFQIKRLYIDCTQTHPPQGGPGIHWGWCQGDEWGSSMQLSGGWCKRDVWGGVWHAYCGHAK